MSKSRYRNLDNLFDVAVNIQAYWSKIDQSAGAQGCWPYLGPKHRQGYGFIGGRRYSDEKRIMLVAHRVGMRIKLGRAITSDEMVVHSCSNMSCQNPDHLMLGDASLRTKNMYANGRGPNPRTGPGSRSHRPQNRKYRLTEAEMLLIKNERPQVAAQLLNMDIGRVYAWKGALRTGYHWVGRQQDK